jgi:hypothetical protein
MYKIMWLEYHNPINWSEKEDYDDGIEQLKKLLPPKTNIHLDPNENDGWVECECVDTFNAKNLKEAKKKASEYDIGDSGVFTVFNKGKRVFTEEDI